MSDVVSTTAVRGLRRSAPLWVIALVVVAIAAAALPAFRSSVSVSSLLASLAPIVLISVGQALTVLYGGIDLSVGAVAGMATVSLALAPVLPGGAPVALVLALVAGVVAGALNGAGVVAGVNPLLMTFAMAGVVQGAALLAQGIEGAGAPFGLIRVLSSTFGPVPLFAPVAVAALLVAWSFIGQSRTGRVILAAGYDRRSAERLDLPLTRTTLAVFAASGLLASLGGLAIVARTFTADALVGSSSVIDSIATVLVAGIAITGGIGSLLSVLPAAVIIAVVGQIITLTGTDPYYQTIFKGCLLIAAVGVYSLAERVRIPWRLAAPSVGSDDGTESAIGPLTRDVPR